MLRLTQTFFSLPPGQVKWTCCAAVAASPPQGAAPTAGPVSGPNPRDRDSG